jgi:predicted nucleotidyltransferase
VTDDEFIHQVVAACRRHPRVEAVVIGGSRARGDHRPDSDWDFAVYYRGDVDVAVFEALGWPGRVFRPFEWGQVMYGGATFDVDGRHVDIHYRNLDVVEHWTDEARRGRFEVHILGFHIAGIPTYMLAGEVASCRTLWGELAPVEFPTALQASAPARWLARAADELACTRHWASTENPVSRSGALARAVLQCAHARPRRDHRGGGALTTGRNVLAAVNVRGRPGPGRPRGRRPRCRRRA